MPGRKQRVCYFYEPEIGSFYYGQYHPMKPHRIRMTHDLLLNYGLYQKMEVYRPHRASWQELTPFHSEDYIEFLSKITPDNVDEYRKQLTRFNVGEDCPVFPGLFDYCKLYTGGSIAGAAKLNQGADVAINWSGGLHHAKKCEASGFCYVNDIVLAILELLKHHARVLYIDIDVHHGDGVEEAFYTTDRVMTLSLHKYGDFFPGTGDVRDIGVGPGKYYTVNFPLKSGISDEAYGRVFRPIFDRICQCYRPGAIVLQCGADSLAGDRLGCFNLSLQGHSDCVKYVHQQADEQGIKLLVLGGGGYTIRNVARAWTYETALCLRQEVPEDLPPNDYWEYYTPDHKISVPSNTMENLNTKEFLDKLKVKILENLRHIQGAPSVQMHHPPEAMHVPGEDEEGAGGDMDVDVRPKEYPNEKVVPDNELYDIKKEL